MELNKKESRNETKRQKDLKEIKKIFPIIDRIKKDQKFNNWSGVEACPICRRKLYIYYFGYNRKTWGRCETKNCIAWMAMLLVGVINSSTVIFESLIPI